MMYFALSSVRDYVADVVEKACKGMGCDEMLLLELFVTKSNEEVRPRVRAG